MAERRQRSGKRRPVRRRKKSGGGKFLFSVLFFVAAAALAIYLTTHTPGEEEGRSEEPRGAVEQILDAVSGPDEENYEETYSEDDGELEEAPPEEERERPPEPEQEPARERPAPPERPRRQERTAPPRAVKRTESAAPAKETAAPPAEKRAPGRLKREAAPAKQALSREVKQYTGSLAVIIDDAGRDLDSQRVYEQMGIPLTLAVMPNQPHTKEAAASWAATGMPVIIHQPMESVSGAASEPIFISTSMTAEQQEKILLDSFAQIPQAVGMNNHQGSKATIHRTTMNNVMKALAARNMFFLDSATNSTTAADAAAAAYGVPYVRNELFVDNTTNVEEIKEMIRKGARMAQGGNAILIGHCRPNTAEAFRQVVPELEAEGIRFIYVSTLTH